MVVERTELPHELAELSELARDLRWTWSHAGDALFRTIDETAWDVSRNPWLVLQSVKSGRLGELAHDAAFRAELDRLLEERALYAKTRPAVSLGGTVSYFSMEYGLGPAVPLYAGGLGVLAGDYLKTASDLGLSVVGVGILYQEGYFRQTIDADGTQHEAYPYNDTSTLPIEPVIGKDGAWVRVALPLPGRAVWLRVWRARVGRVELLLLDANDIENQPADRGITAKLYGGDQEMRLLQEIVLGIGGPRALEAVGIDATVAHLNEGHTAFVALERARSFAARRGTSFEQAIWATRASNVFTTHTPVRAGFDSFPAELIATYFPPGGDYLGPVGFPLDRVLSLGREDPGDSHEPFSMVAFAMRCSGQANGVSRVHAEVSRSLFAGLFPRWPISEVPIRHVTNGVHASSWDSSAADDLWTRACGKGRWLGSVEPLREAVACVSDEELWRLRSDARKELIHHARRRLRGHLSRRGKIVTADRAGDILDDETLTLGFGRRFAEYKRPNLLLSNPERLTRLLCDESRPVQLVIAGKAHPSDAQGKRLIADWIAYLARPGVRERAVFLEDYDMTVAEEMVRGVDVWVNTPRRPWEACGTSGMKVLVNGGLNLSELDGWWAEAWSQEVGWALGGRGVRTDAEDAEALYALLERDVVPCFYDRDATGTPRRWVSKIRASMSQLTPLFSSNRMLREYAEDLYAPAIRAFQRRTADGSALAKELAHFGERLAAHFHQVHFGDVDVEPTASGFRHRVIVHLGELEPHEVEVELYADPVAPGAAVRVPMARARTVGPDAHLYDASVATARPATDFTARVIPRQPEAFIPAELPFILWRR